jgi:hypothetical protein
MRPRKIVAIVIGAFLVLIGLALLAPGVAILGVHGALMDESGFYQTSDRVVSTGGYALVSPDVKLNIGPGDWQWVPTGGRAAVRVRASSTGSEPIFIGIGPSDKVAEYVDGVARDEVTDYGWWSSVKYLHFDGGAPASPPGEQTFWVASAEGTGVQSAEWEVEGGNWTAVVMNADGSAPVSASMSLGARFGILLPIGIAVTVVAVIFLGVGILLIVLGARRDRSAMPAQPPMGSAPPPGWNQSQAGWTQTQEPARPPSEGTTAQGSPPPDTRPPDVPPPDTTHPRV